MASVWADAHLFFSFSNEIRTQSRNETETLLLNEDKTPLRSQHSASFYSIAWNQARIEIFISFEANARRIEIIAQMVKLIKTILQLDLKIARSIGLNWLVLMLHLMNE